jgi:hypothetical protein
LSIGGHEDSIVVWGGLSAIPSLWYQFGTFLSLPSTWFLVQPLADSRKYTKGVVSNILESHGGRIEDNKKHGAVFDMDPSAHYEIDRSELEPMEHIPPLSKVRHFPQHYCLLYEELLIRPWTLLVFPCKAWEKTIVAAGKQFLEKILWKFLADLTVWPHWWVCIVDVL